MNAADGSGQTNLTNNAAFVVGTPAWSPDGTKIAFTNTREGNVEVYVMNVPRLRSDQSREQHGR